MDLGGRRMGNLQIFSQGRRTAYGKTVLKYVRDREREREPKRTTKDSCEATLSGIIFYHRSVSLNV